MEVTPHRWDNVDQTEFQEKPQYSIRPLGGTPTLWVTTQLLSSLYSKLYKRLANYFLTGTHKEAAFNLVLFSSQRPFMLKS